MFYLLLVILYVFDCICKYFLNTDQISNTNICLFVIFNTNTPNLCIQIQMQIVFEPNPAKQCFEIIPYWQMTDFVD